MLLFLVMSLLLLLLLLLLVFLLFLPSLWGRAEPDPPGAARPGVGGPRSPASAPRVRRPLAGSRHRRSPAATPAEPPPSRSPTPFICPPNIPSFCRFLPWRRGPMGRPERPGTPGSLEMKGTEGRPGAPPRPPTPPVRQGSARLSWAGLGSVRPRFSGPTPAACRPVGPGCGEGRGGKYGAGGTRTRVSVQGHGGSVHGHGGSVQGHE